MNTTKMLDKVCRICGKAIEWQYGNGVPVVPDSSGIVVVPFATWVKPVGHERCQETRRAELDRMRDDESAARDRHQRRTAVAASICWPLQRYDELTAAGFAAGLDKARAWEPGKPGLLLYGTAGTGKTFALRQLAVSLNERFGLWPHWVNVNRWLDEMRSKLDASERMTAAAEGAAVLFLDDIGSEKLTEWSESKVERILTHRFDFQLPTFASTNLTPSGFADRFGQRIVSRLTGLCELVAVPGRDRRPDAVRQPKREASCDAN